MDYGTQVLSHPFIVDASREFVPLCIYNNTTGDHDDTIRKRFKERAWNNPVVRFLDPKGKKDLIRKVDRDWSYDRLVQAMADALSAHKKDGAPSWLRLVSSEVSAHRNGLETAIFGMT